MSDHPESRNGDVHPSVKYESTDLSLRAVLTFSGTLVVVLAVVAIGLWFLIPAILGPTTTQAPKDAWNFPDDGKADVSHLAPPPELEAIDRTGPPAKGGTHTIPIQKQIENEEHTLSTYGPGADAGKYRIPIEKAMDRLAGDAGGKP